MKLHYFFGCILAAASLVVWPEIGLAHGGGGGRGGGGGGSHFVGTDFTARSGNRFDRHFHNGNGDVVIFDQLDYGSYYDLSTDGRVEAAGVGIWDVFEREGGFAQMFGIEPKFPYVLGSDGAGTVAPAGEQVSRFKEGDQVY